MSDEPKHTPTPWTDDKFTPIPAGDDRLLLGMFRETPKVAVRVLSEENYRHAVKCVNACEDLDDPEKWIKQMKEYRVEMSNSSLSAEINKRIETQSELKSLRAENAELIEALRSIITISPHGNDLTELAKAKWITSQTLAKYDKP